MADGKVKEPEHAKIDEIVEEDDEFEEFEDEVPSPPDAQLLLDTQEAQLRREMRAGFQEMLGTVRAQTARARGSWRGWWAVCCHTQGVGGRGARGDCWEFR